VYTFEFNANPSVMTVLPLRAFMELTKIDFIGSGHIHNKCSRIE
jgi:hypothetical protein